MSEKITPWKKKTSEAIKHSNIDTISGSKAL